jgi:hypothetical protein
MVSGQDITQQSLYVKAVHANKEGARYENETLGTGKDIKYRF